MFEIERKNPRDLLSVEIAPLIDLIAELIADEKIKELQTKTGRKGIYEHCKTENTDCLRI